MDHRSTNVIGSRGLKKLYDLTTILKLDIVQPATSLQGLILRPRVCETVCVCETMCVYVPQEPTSSLHYKNAEVRNQYWATLSTTSYQFKKKKNNLEFFVGRFPACFYFCGTGLRLMLWHLAFSFQTSGLQAPKKCKKRKVPYVIRHLGWDDICRHSNVKTSIFSEPRDPITFVDLWSIKCAGFWKKILYQWPRKLTRTWKIVVGRLPSFWDGPFYGDMLVFWGLHFVILPQVHCSAPFFTKPCETLRQWTCPIEQNASLLGERGSRFDSKEEAFRT